MAKGEAPYDADVASAAAGNLLAAVPDTSLIDFGWDLAQATYVSTRVHTEPQAFGKVMSTLKPRMAVGYHSVQSPDNNAAILTDIGVQPSEVTDRQLQGNFSVNFNEYAESAISTCTLRRLRQ